MVYRILVVEDEQDGQDVLIDVLSFFEFEAEVAASAEQAMALLQKTAYDAAIIDLSLPGMNGFELVEHIRSRPETMNLPCLAYTAYYTSKVRYETMKAGFNAYCQKPVRSNILIDTLRGIITASQ